MNLSTYYEPNGILGRYFRQMELTHTAYILFMEVLSN